MRPSDLAAARRVQDDLKSGAARAERVALGVSGAAVARAMRPRVSPQAVWSWEAKVNTPTEVHALAYGRVLAALSGGRPSERLPGPPEVGARPAEADDEHRAALPGLRRVVHRAGSR